MEEKLRFIFEYERGERSMSELCQRYEIARETGYVWLRRYQQAGVPGLVEHSRAAQRHANQTPEEIEQKVLELRQAHMRWGPRKLKRILERDEPVGLLPDDDRWFTIYFAQLPPARFDSRKLQVVSLPASESFARAGCGEGDASPSPAPHPFGPAEDQKVSGMCPV